MDPLVILIVATLVVGAILLLRGERHDVGDDKPTLDVQNHVGDRP
jgi:hypothetical protein